jgi:SAM-dependent methyltransferase/organic radical activating enzyme
MMIDWSEAPKFGRTYTIKYALDQLHSTGKKKPVIVETGTTRGSLGGGWKGDGWATVAFGWYATNYGGKVYTVDMEKEAIEECKVITEEYKDVITYVVGDSVKWLSKHKYTIDFLYLDSADDPNVAMAELQAAYPRLHKTSIILIDDTHNKMTQGKGVIAGPWLVEQGWTVLEDFGGSVLLLSPGGNFPVEYEAIQYLHEKGIQYSISDYGDKAITWQQIFFSFLPSKDVLPRVRGHARALDLGCNTGYNVRELEKKYGYAAGVDINEKLIQVSKLNSDNCYVMRIEDLKFEDESFCVVAAKDVFEHASDPDAALEEAYRVLVDGGYLVAMIPLDGEPQGADDITIHKTQLFNNAAHMWKATADGVMRRLNRIGFTEFELRIDLHSALFGQERSFGDRVLTVRAKKVKGIKKIPFVWTTPAAYLGAFITMTCNGHCKYCIQHMHKKPFLKAQAEFARGELPPNVWIEFWNSLQRSYGARLSIVGGEPTVHYGFFDIVNGITGYYKTVTTNLTTPVFDDVDAFAAQIQNKDDLRLNTSFHPHLTDAKTFCDKIHKLRFHGFNVDQIAMVDYPTSNWRKYYYEFLQYGLHLQPQTFTGKIDGMLVPEPSGMTSDYGDTGIGPYDVYVERCGADEPQEVFCSTARFLVGPDGGIYRCHHHLYTRSNSIGHIMDDELPQRNDFTECHDYGHCNPCDFSQMAVRSPVFNVPHMIHAISHGRPGVSGGTMKVIEDNIDTLGNVLNVVVSELSTSIDPYWELYNSKIITDTVSDFLEADEKHVELLRQLAGALFQYLPGGVNIYRILREDTIEKIYGGK